MKKIFIDIGHGITPDTGAVGLIAEETVINAVGTIVIQKLKAKGYSVEKSNVISPSSVTDSLNQRVAQSKAFGPDLFISIHANASVNTDKPVGTEVYYNNKGTSLASATKIVNNIANLGFKNRGTKTANFRVLSANSAPSILVELFFVDSKADVALYNTKGAVNLAEAIVAGIEGTTTGTSSVSNDAVENKNTSETERFICKIKQYCAKKNFNTTAFLAVRLFETGGSLSAWYYASIKQSVQYVEKGERLSAFGLLQWTPIGLEPVLKDLGITTGKTRAGHILAYQKVQKYNRLEQLDLCFKYFDFWDPITSKRTGIDRTSILYQYVLTLSPGAGANYKDGNGVTANDLINKKNFKAYLAQAEGMLNGSIAVPNDSSEVQVIRPDGLATYQKIQGSQKVSPSTCDIAGDYTQNVLNNSSTTSKQAEQKASTSIEDKLPLKLNFSIPEYPRLINLKPGDVIILPPSATYRDWLVTSVNREFNQGLNILSIQANRPLSTKPFVQSEGLNPKNIFNTSTMDYYWLTN
jgi:N-acetylmuramoyl-L-alanine amidase